MSSELSKLTAKQLRKLIKKATTRLAELKPPEKKWLIQLWRTRTIHDNRCIVVEARDKDTAIAAAEASQDCLSVSDEWEGDDEVTAFYTSGYEAESDYDPDYRVGANGRLEEVK